ncbi:MAG: pyridoxal-dependent decarboxylase, partial [Ilumatobacteraceae bacterium]
VPVRPDTATVDVDAMASLIDSNTAAIVGSACNYGYGTIDPIEELSALALQRGVGLHVDGCLGGFLLPFGEMLGFDIPVFDFRHPGVTTISADTHKYGYSVKGTSILMFRNKDLRNGQYFFMTDWSGGKYASPGIDGSRSSGLLAATWASLVSLGREGYLKYAKKIFETAYAMQDVVRAQPELRIIGNPSFCFSFTSDVFDIYHVNDALRAKGWRLNGQQYPNAVHMAVTRPQTQEGVLEAWVDDLPAAVAYANEHRDEPAQSSAIYGGSTAPTAEITAKINAFATALLDAYQSLPPLP